MSDSNIDAFSASLDRLSNPLDFTRDGLGKRIAESQAKRVAERAANNQGTTGTFAENRGDYGKRKQARGIPVGVGIKSGGAPMLNPANLAGQPAIERDSVTMEASEKAQWFHNGSEGTEGEKSGAKNQPARPFYGLTDSDAEAIQLECGKAVANVIRGGG